MAYQSKHKKSRETQLVIEGVSLEGLSLREFDRVVFERFGAVCGIDEAGRGPIAGPVCAAAVILDPENPIEGLNDSKKLSPKKREGLYEEIWDKALFFSVSFVSAEDIDKTDILSADLTAMERAFGNIGGKCGIVLVDGDVLPQLDALVKNVIGGDAKSEAIAAASILAKVERDEYMCEMAEKYPGYGFEKHKGYGTKAHYEAIERLGLCPIHRKTFLKKYGQTS
ncbi:MAG: ribonuclease HII [Lachnospiraceae bacterium]|nr:ribonuclease HII [Ruminococcus sp.]MCM1275872.1 ribonuclease HII [Lachnospiraceae bacterium]